MELSEIRTKINDVDDELLRLFLERMELSEEVAAYKNEHHLPILNKERERAILAKVTEKAGDKERYAYHLFSTLFELSRSRQAELISAPTKVEAQVKASLAAGGDVFPQTGLVACQGVEGANSQVACDKLLPRGNIVYVKSFEALSRGIVRRAGNGVQNTADKTDQAADDGGHQRQDQGVPHAGDIGGAVFAPQFADVGRQLDEFIHGEGSLLYGFVNVLERG